MPEDAWRKAANRTNLAADLAVCKARKADFNTTHGDCSDTAQLCPCCPVGGLNAKACHDRREVAGKVCGLDLSRELALRLRLLQALLQSRFTTFSPIDHRLLHRLRICATCQCPLDRETSATIAGGRKEFRGSKDHPRYDFPQLRLSESLPDVGHPGLPVAIHHPVKDCFLVAKSRVHAGTVDSHRLGQVGYGRAFVALLPEDPHRSFERGGFIKSARPPHPHFHCR